MGGLPYDVLANVGQGDQQQQPQAQPSLAQAIAMQQQAQSAQPQQQAPQMQPQPQNVGYMNQPSRLKAMLAGGASALLHFAGVQTPEEIQQKQQEMDIQQQHANAAMVQAQGINAWRQAMAGQYQGIPITPDMAKARPELGPFVGQVLDAKSLTGMLGKTIPAETRTQGALSLEQMKQASPRAQAQIRADNALADYRSALATAEPQKIENARLALENALRHQRVTEGIAGANLGMRQMEFQQKQQALSPAAQTVLMASTPVHDQIKDLMTQFEPMKEDNTPGKFAASRALYALGMHTDIGNAPDTIAQLELNKVAGAARVMKGSSRSIQALKLAMTHLPEVWKDSPQLIYTKLSNLDKALQQIEDDAQKYGAKTGVIRNTPKPFSFEDHPVAK